MKFPYICIDNFYTKEECRAIWQEIEFLSHPHKWSTQETDPTDGARDDDGKQLKNNKFIWIDNFYSVREYSNILCVNRKLFDASPWLTHEHCMFRNFDCRRDTTLLSCYDFDDSQYKLHNDSAHLTCLTWFYQEPKKYEGGDLILKDEDDILNIESLNNRLLIFPSRIWHQVTPIKFNGTKMTDGRYCMTQFLHHG
jgi:hypothetical protein